MIQWGSAPNCLWLNYKCTKKSRQTNSCQTAQQTCTIQPLKLPRGCLLQVLFHSLSHQGSASQSLCPLVTITKLLVLLAVCSLVFLAFLGVHLLIWARLALWSSFCSKVDPSVIEPTCSPSMTCLSIILPNHCNLCWVHPSCPNPDCSIYLVHVGRLGRPVWPCPISPKWASISNRSQIIRSQLLALISVDLVIPSASNPFESAWLCLICPSLSSYAQVSLTMRPRHLEDLNSMDVCLREYTWRVQPTIVVRGNLCPKAPRSSIATPKCGSANFVDPYKCRHPSQVHVCGQGCSP